LNDDEDRWYRISGANLRFPCLTFAYRIARRIPGAQIFRMPENKCVYRDGHFVD